MGQLLNSFRRIKEGRQVEYFAGVGYVLPTV